MINAFSSGLGQSLVRNPLAGPTEAASQSPQSLQTTSGFGNMMSSMISDAVSAVRLGETSAIAGMQGKMPLQQVVEAVMQAEQSLHTAVVVRDKVVGAYLEISRMQM